MTMYDVTASLTRYKNRLATARTKHSIVKSSAVFSHLFTFQPYGTDCTQALASRQIQLSSISSLPISSSPSHHYRRHSRLSSMISSSLPNATLLSLWKKGKSINLAIPLVLVIQAGAAINRSTNVRKASYQEIVRDNDNHQCLVPSTSEFTIHLSRRW